MSNLNALRTTLKKLGTNAAQLFTPSVVRVRGGAPSDILDSNASMLSSVCQEGAADERTPDVVMPEWDATLASSGHSARMPATVPVHDVVDIPSSSVTVQLAPLPQAEPEPDVPGLDDDVITQQISPTSPVASPRLHAPPTIAADRATPTVEQNVVARAPANERQLVIAGPGTGKTFTVIQRLEYLLGAGGLDAGQILVLSFSRSAVREVRTRLRARVAEDGAHGDLDFLQVRTFDSFAYRLLEEVGQTPDLSADSYDRNIQRASQLIAKLDSEARSAVAGLQHLIVDELQDLVGVRAALVESILKAMTGGFTLLGDPAQAIYDYQARQTRGPTATSFLRWLREHKEQWHLQERTLTRNLRGSKKCFAVSERHRPTILNTETAHEAFGALKADLETLPGVGTVSKIDDSLRRLPPGWTAAILCRSNNEALQVHMHLLEQKISHVLAINVEDVGLPAWVGRVFSTWTAPEIMQAQFVRLWTDSIGSRVNITPDDAWKALVRAAGKPDGTRRLRMESLRKVLAGRPELPGDSGENVAPITVSTIHRAKGREYDWVIVLDSNPDGSSVHYGKRGRRQDAEEARVLYVAATRARQRLSRLRRGGLGQCLSLCGRENVTLPDGDVLVEVGAQGDVDILAGVRVSRYQNAAEVVSSQDYLWEMATGVHKGVVNLIRARPGWGYKIRAADAPAILGRMSPAFGSGMELLSQWLAGEPGNLHGVPVRAIETVVLANPRDDICPPYGQSGVFLTLRPQGAVFAGKKGG